MWFGVAEIQEIFEDETETDISDDDGQSEWSLADCQELLDKFLLKRKVELLTLLLRKLPVLMSKRMTRLILSILLSRVLLGSVLTTQVVRWTVGQEECWEIMECLRNMG